MSQIGAHSPDYYNSDLSNQNALNHAVPNYLTLDDIVSAKERISPFIQVTPLAEVEPNVFLKCEHKQVTKSFKPRGACNALLCLSDAEKAKGVIARSSGNFAQGLSYIAQKLGVSATVVMPEHAPKVKVESTQRFGSRVFLKGRRHEESQALVDELASAENLTKMHPYNDVNVMAGQGSAMLEICDVLTTIDLFFCPMSGGGLLAGCAVALKTIHPSAIVIGVEPLGADDYSQSRRSGTVVELASSTSIADGLLAPSVGTLCKPILDAYVDDITVVTDSEIMSAMAILHQKGEQVEPSGAAAYAAYLQYRNHHPISGSVVVCMASGGNFDPKTD